jgi:hypothetical protein
MNWFNYKDEGFVSQKEAEVQVSDVEIQVRKVLEDLTVNEICPIYDTIRKNMKKNELAGPTPAKSDAEAERRVEANLSIKIPGGALPCPLLTYPRPGSNDLAWLDFVQKIPVDYGARIVFMAIFAKEYLGSTAKLMKDALDGKGKIPPADEGFVVCSPDVIDTRKAEKLKKNKEGESCDMPEDLSPEQIKEAVTVILKQLVAEKTTRLTAKKVDPQIDILPLIKDATKSAEYLNKKGKEANEGSLQMTGTISP